MARFCVYKVSGGRLVLDLQTDLINTGTRIVAPLFELGSGPRPIRQLEPVLEIMGGRYVLHTAELAAIPSGVLSEPPVADLTSHAYEITRALDMVFSGF